MAETPRSTTTVEPPVRINRTTTAVSLLLILVFVGIGAVWPEQSAAVFDRVQNQVLLTFRWYFVAIVGFVLAFVLWLGFGRYRNVRLGNDDEAPEFTYASWFSMLLSSMEKENVSFFTRLVTLLWRFQSSTALINNAGIIDFVFSSIKA